jgi:uncharacterized membrane protein YfcA
MPLLPILLVGSALGLVLGILGGGGGILAVPLLVRVFGQDLDAATTASLVVVAIGALAGLVPHARAGRVDWATGLTFGVLGSAGAVLGARGALWADDRLQAAGFVVLLVVAGVSMVRKPRPTPAAVQSPVPVGVGVGGGTGAAPPDTPESGDDAGRRRSWARILVAATIVGLITGFFGVGGGFIAVPALVFGVGMPVRRATATGLLVIVLNSAVALVARGSAYLDTDIVVPLGIVNAVAAAVGAVLSGRLPSIALRRGFGVLVLLVAVAEAVVLLNPALAPGA